MTLFLGAHGEHRAASDCPAMAFGDHERYIRRRGRPLSSSSAPSNSYSRLPKPTNTHHPYPHPRFTQWLLRPSSLLSPLWAPPLPLLSAREATAPSPETSPLLSRSWTPTFVSTTPTETPTSETRSTAGTATAPLRRSRDSSVTMASSAFLVLRTGASVVGLASKFNTVQKLTCSQQAERPRPRLVHQERPRDHHRQLRLWSSQRAGLHSRRGCLPVHRRRRCSGSDLQRYLREGARGWCPGPSCHRPARHPHSHLVAGPRRWRLQGQLCSPLPDQPQHREEGVNEPTSILANNHTNTATLYEKLFDTANVTYVQSIPINGAVRSSSALFFCTTHSPSSTYPTAGRTIAPQSTLKVYRRGICLCQHRKQNKVQPLTAGSYRGLPMTYTAKTTAVLH